MTDMQWRLQSFLKSEFLGSVLCWVLQGEFSYLFWRSGFSDLLTQASRILSLSFS
jgi:hypothetical protein